MTTNRNTRLQKVSLHDQNDDAFSLSNPVPIVDTNPRDNYPLPAEQFDAISKEATQLDVLSNLVSLLNSFSAEDFAQEATLSTFKDSFDSRDLATQTTLASLLTAFNNEDFASESTLELIRILLVAIDSKDFATESTLNGLKTSFDNRDIATETTLELIRLLLVSLEGKDYATEDTLAALKAAFDSRDLASSAKQDIQVSELQDINSELDGQSSILGDISLKDFATESTLESFKEAFDSRDLASTAKQDSIISEMSDANAELDLITALLTQIEANTDEIEVKIDSVSINTDELESKLDVLIAKDYSTEVTLAAFKASSDTRLDHLSGDLDTLNAKDFATSAKQDDIVNGLIDIETELQGVNSELDAQTSILADIEGKDFSTSAKQDAQITKLQDIEADVEAAVAELEILSAVDYATEAKQDVIILELQNIESDVEAAVVQLATLNTKDFATQTTLTAVLAELQLKADLSETQPVNVQNTSIAVTGPLTDAQLRATPVPVSAAQSGAWTVGVNNFPAAQNVNLRDENGNAFSETNPLTVSSMSDLVSEKYTNMQFSYVPSGNGVGEIQTVIYRNGATTIATLTLGYDAQNRITSVTRS